MRDMFGALKTANLTCCSEKGCTYLGEFINDP